MSWFLEVVGVIVRRRWLVLIALTGLALIGPMVVPPRANSQFRPMMDLAMTFFHDFVIAPTSAAVSAGPTPEAQN